MKVLGWYVVDNRGDATSFDGAKMARSYAERWDTSFPRNAPHRAVLLAEIDESEIPKDQQS